MSRLFWVAVGAAGGILAYRRGERLVAEARERGLVATAQQAAVAAVTTATTVRQAVAGAATSRGGNG